MANVLVLNVDPDADSLAARSLLLKAAGVSVIETASQGDVFSIIRSHQPGIVILKDYATDTSRFELCRQLKRNSSTSGLPILQISAAPARESDLVAALDQGADLYLAEPYTSAALLASVRSLARRCSSERISPSRTETAAPVRINGKVSEQHPSGAAELATCVEDLPSVHRAGSLNQPVEERLKSLGDALERSNADLQELAYAVSHDLQEPLRMVYNFGNLIMKRHATALTDEGREFFQFMIDGAQRMDRMIRDLLSYSRVTRDESKLEPTDLGAALHWAISKLEEMIQDTGATVTSTELPEVCGDFDHLSRVFQSVLENSIKYRGPEAPDIRISASEDAGLWTIAVRDNGIGMNPKHAHRAFGVFQRLHGSDYSGSGMGLAICKRIIEQHGGRIWVEASLGAGCTLFFTLPSPRWP